MSHGPGLRQAGAAASIDSRPFSALKQRAEETGAEGISRLPLAFDVEDEKAVDGGLLAQF